MAISELPIGLALLFCDTLIEDIRTRKKSLIGLYTQIIVTQFPYTHPNLNIFVSVTGCTSQNFPCKLRCEKAADGKCILEVTCQLNANSPQDVVDLAITLKQIQFPSPGRYSIKLIVDDVPIMMRPLKLILKNQKSSTPPPRHDNP